MISRAYEAFRRDIVFVGPKMALQAERRFQAGPSAPSLSLYTFYDKSELKISITTL